MNTGCINDKVVANEKSVTVFRRCENIGLANQASGGCTLQLICFR
jgi:hypothetical protein